MIEEIISGVGKPINTMENIQSGGLVTHPNTKSETMKIENAEAPAESNRSMSPIAKPAMILEDSVLLVEVICGRNIIQHKIYKK
jgi:hypothetical protein